MRDSALCSGIDCHSASAWSKDKCEHSMTCSKDSRLAIIVMPRAWVRNQTPMNQQTTTSRGLPSRWSPGQSTKKGRAHPFLLLLRSCLSSWSLVFSVLPYNLNWMRKSFEWFGAFLEKNPITLFDIGARGGSP